MWLAEYSLSERTRALITRQNVRIRNLTPHVLNHFCEKNRIYLFDSNGSSQTLNTSVNVTLVIVKNRLFSSFCSIFESIKNELTTEGHLKLLYKTNFLPLRVYAFRHLFMHFPQNFKETLFARAPAFR